MKTSITEMVTKIMETSPAEYADALAVFESCFKDLGASLPEIKVCVLCRLGQVMSHLTPYSLMENLHVTQ